jgi:hypothetical protein
MPHTFEIKVLIAHSDSLISSVMMFGNVSSGRQ